MKIHWIFLLLGLMACLSVTASKPKQPYYTGPNVKNHLVILYDSSRDIYVKLTNTQAFFNWGIGSDPNADYWSLIAENPTGTWTSNTRFTDQTGYFEQVQGDNWIENQYSGSVNYFVRVN